MSTSDITNEYKTGLDDALDLLAKAREELKGCRPNTAVVKNIEKFLVSHDAMEPTSVMYTRIKEHLEIECSSKCLDDEDDRKHVAKSLYEYLCQLGVIS
jgi:hypothetical protein